MVLFVLFLILMVVGLALLIEAADKQRLASVRRRLRTAALVSLALSLMAIALNQFLALAVREVRLIPRNRRQCSLH
jgi:hypothetical protein